MKCPHVTQTLGQRQEIVLTQTNYYHDGIGFGILTHNPFSQISFP